jgi:hypothetical protein
VVTHWNVIANGQVVGRYEGTTKLVPSEAEGKYSLRLRSGQAWRDHLGSIRVVVNSSGSVLQADDFYPYGLKMPRRSFVSEALAKACPERSREKSFTGKERDAETGLRSFASIRTSFGVRTTCRRWGGGAWWNGLAHCTLGNAAQAILSAILQNKGNGLFQVLKRFFLCTLLSIGTGHFRRMCDKPAFILRHDGREFVAHGCISSAFGVSILTP